MASRIFRIIVLVTTAAASAVASTTTAPCNTGWGCAPAVTLGSFPNGGLAGTLVSAGADTYTIDGWTFYNKRVQLNGNSVIAGFPTPTDTKLPPSCPCPNDDCVLNSESYSTQISSFDPPAGSSQYADMGSNLQSAQGFAIAHGPYMVSNGSIGMRAGSLVSFDWRANQGADAYDVYAYLLRTDAGGAGATIELLNEWGNNGVWKNKVVNVTASGEYAFVFMSGTWDQSGGRALGARLQITNVKVTGNTNVTSLPLCVDACKAYDNATAFVNFDSSNNDCACSAACTSYAQTANTTQAFAIGAETCPNVPTSVCGVDVACVAPTTAASVAVSSLQQCVNQCSLDSGDNRFVKYLPTSTCLCQKDCLAQVPSPGYTAASYRRGTCSLFPPTPMPTRQPTKTPTSNPTAGPTPVPLSVAYSRVAKVTIAEGTSDAIFPADMATASKNPEACYQACLAALNNAPTFYYNVYTASGEQRTCSCVKDFKAMRQLPPGSTGAAYLVCPGEDPNGVIGIRTKVNTVAVLPGKVLRWKAEVTNLDEATTLDGMGFQLTVPAYTRVVRTGTKPELTPFLNGSAVVWTGFDLRPGARRPFQVVLRVAANAPVDTALNLAAFTFTTVDGSTEVFCPYSANALTVKVVKRPTKRE